MHAATAHLCQFKTYNLQFNIVLFDLSDSTAVSAVAFLQPQCVQIESNCAAAINAGYCTTNV